MLGGYGVAKFDYTVYGDNCENEWKLWLRSFELFMKASNVTDDEQKQTMLLHFGGQKVQELYDLFSKEERGNHLVH